VHPCSAGRRACMQVDKVPKNIRGRRYVICKPIRVGVTIDRTMSKQKGGDSMA